MQFTQQEAAVILSSTFVLELLTGHFNSLQNTLYFLILWEMIINLKFYSYLSYVYVWFIYFLWWNKCQIFKNICQIGFE